LVFAIFAQRTGLSISPSMDQALRDGNVIIIIKLP